MTEPKREHTSPPVQPAEPSRPADWDQRVANYDRQFKLAADALVAAIRAKVTDGAETISQLLATAAADQGGMHMLTAARPGSWEADYVDRFLASTVGPDGDYLLEYRTASIEVVECVEAAMVDLAIDWLYDESRDLIEVAEDDAIPENGNDEAAERVARAEDLIDQLRDRDYASYREAFEQRVRAAADELRRARHLPAAVQVFVRWVEWADRGQATDAQEAWGTVEYELWETARLQTPPPGFTEPLADITGPRTPADILRTTGRMPHQRIPELAHYSQPAHQPDNQTDEKPAQCAAETSQEGEQS
jgi:hypothetical protein